MRAFLPLLVMAVFVASNVHAQAPKQQEPAQQKPAPYLDIQHVISDGGIEAWLVEDHSVPIVDIQFAFKHAGAAQNEATQQGLARLLSNTLDEGAADLDSQRFQKMLSDSSITLRFGAGRDHFTGSFKALSKHLAQGLEMLKLSLSEPRFDQEAVDRMRAANQSRIRNSLSDPNWIAARFMNDVAYNEHPYALNSGGTLASLDAITPQDLRDYHARVIGRNNLVVAASGDINAAQLKLVLDSIFGGLPQVDLAEAAPLELQNQGEIFVYKKDIPQTIIEIMQPGIDRRDSNYHSAQVMNFILGSSGFGSRLTEEIREKRGLTYGIYSQFLDTDAIDTITVGTSTKNENVDEMLSLINAEFDRMKAEPISDQELSDAKSYLIGSLPLSLTSTSKISSLLLSLMVNDLPIDYLDQRAAAIDAITIQDVQNIAQSLLSPESFVSVLVGNPDTASSTLRDAVIRKEIPNAE